MEAMLSSAIMRHCWIAWGSSSSNFIHLPPPASSQPQLSLPTPTPFPPAAGAPSQSLMQPDFGWIRGRLAELW
ncbi:hypothetical protein ACP4OV_008822 [Aristida adscensionis]